MPHVQKKKMMHFKRRPSMITGTWRETSQSLNRGSVRHDSRCSTTIHQKGYIRVQGRLTKKQVTTRPGNIWPEQWSNMSKGSQRKTKNEWAERKPKLDDARDQRGIYSIPDNGFGHEVIIDNAKRKQEIRRASAMPCKVATPANPNGSSWRRPCASEWSKMETKKAKLLMFKARSRKPYHRIANDSNH